MHSYAVYLLLGVCRFGLDGRLSSNLRIFLCMRHLTAYLLKPGLKKVHIILVRRTQHVFFVTNYNTYIRSVIISEITSNACSGNWEIATNGVHQANGISIVYCRNHLLPGLQEGCFLNLRIVCLSLGFCSERGLM